GVIPEGQTDPILDQEALWAIKPYVEARRVVAIEEGEIEAD
ncbi:MAG TPA: cytochrome c-550 PedF, partial [Alteromonas mediterranea]|nr:cytochrome c-550 PedF [Alteromonas mediterranea]